MAVCKRCGERGRRTVYAPLEAGKRRRKGVGCDKCVSYYKIVWKQLKNWSEFGTHSSTLEQVGPPSNCRCEKCGKEYPRYTDQEKYKFFHQDGLRIYRFNSGFCDPCLLEREREREERKRAERFYKRFAVQPTPYQLAWEEVMEQLILVRPRAPTTVPSSPPPPIYHGCDHAYCGFRCHKYAIDWKTDRKGLSYPVFADDDWYNNNTHYNTCRLIFMINFSTKNAYSRFCVNGAKECSRLISICN